MESDDQSMLLSRAECIDIARKSIGKDVEVVDHCITCISGQLKGFLGEYFTLEIIFKDENDHRHARNYFVKTTAKNQEDTLHIFTKEVSLYSSLLEKLSKYGKLKWKPNCYLTRRDILVLEDLMFLGYENIPENIEVNLQHMKIFLSSLAAFHASSIAHEEETGKSISSEYKDILFETSVQKDLNWFLAGIWGLQAVASVHPAFQSKDHKDFIDGHFIRSLDPVYGMIEESDIFCNVLCHRDTWNNNGLFKFENGDYENPRKCIFVDFQMCRYSPPAIDVLLTIYLNTSGTFRKTIINECLEYYHEKLRNELADMKINIDDHLTWEAFLKSCNYLKLFPILYNGVAATLLRLPGDFLEDLQRTDPIKFRNYRLVNRRDIILDFISKDLTFKNYMFEIVEDLMDIIYKKPKDLVQ